MLSKSKVIKKGWLLLEQFSLADSGPFSSVRSYIECHSRASVLAILPSLWPNTLHTNATSGRDNLCWLTVQAIVFRDREGLAGGSCINDDKSMEQLLFSSVTHQKTENSGGEENGIYLSWTPPPQWSTSSLGRPPFLKTPQAPQMAPLTRVQIRDPFTQKPQPRLLLSAGTDGAEALLLVDFPISETDTSRSTGWGVWVWKMTKIGAWQERGLYLITVKWFDNCREHWKIPGYTLIFGMFSSTQTPHTPSKEVL